MGYPVEFRVIKRASPSMTFLQADGVTGGVTYARSGSTGSASANTGGVLSTHNTLVYSGNLGGGSYVAANLRGYWIADAEL